MESNYPFSTGRSSLLGTEAFRNLLGESIKKSEKKIIILSAYIKKVGMIWLQEQINKKNIECIIICRWSKNDLANGASDLECYDVAKNNNWSFRILKDLHAKVMLIDDTDLFLGSPNLTGHGMSLVPVSNKEIGVKLLSNSNDKKIINQLISDSVLINDEIFEELKKWKNLLPNFEKTSYPDFPLAIKEKLNENYNSIWVHNFPWTNFENFFNYKKINDNIIHDLELFGFNFKQTNISKEDFKKNFEKSKIFQWLVFQIKKREKSEIFFGDLSSLIHDCLLDDPTPYRKDIKQLQSNLYSFIKNLDLNQIIIDRPNYSERLKVIN